MLFQETSLTLSVSVLVAVAFPLGLLVVLLGCLQCFRKKQGFSNFENSTGSINDDTGQINSSFTLNIDDTNGDLPSSTAVTIEPLPDIAKLKLPTAPQRPRICCLDRAKQEASLKLIAVHRPFPRSQIVYLKELGTGWFGKVIESDAERIITGVARSKVVIKMLKDDANRDEQQLFFEEVAPYRELEHTNIVRLLGQCMETSPLLMVLESAAYGSLKEYLRSHGHSLPVLIQKNRLMQFALDASCGLACLHRHDYLHRDLAARNCLVMNDYTLKLGDYGIAEDLFSEDYLTSDGNLLPIRWMAPEILQHNNGIWTSHNFSKQSDIWSLGVVLWEIATMGAQPYGTLSDGEVLQRVLVDQSLRLPEPDLAIPHKQRLYEVMRFCWLEPSQRTKVDEVYGLLQQISTLPSEQALTADTVTPFQHKWDQLTPNQRHLSADSLDDQLASSSRGDSNLVTNQSHPDSLEDLTVQGLGQSDSGSVASKDFVKLEDLTAPGLGQSDSGSVASKDFVKLEDGFVMDVLHPDSLTVSGLGQSDSGSVTSKDFVKLEDGFVMDVLHPDSLKDLTVPGLGQSDSGSVASKDFVKLEDGFDMDVLHPDSLTVPGLGQSDSSSVASRDFVKLEDGFAMDVIHPDSLKDLTVPGLGQSDSDSVASKDFVRLEDLTVPSLGQSDSGSVTSRDFVKLEDGFCMDVIHSSQPSATPVANTEGVTGPVAEQVPTGDSSAFLKGGLSSPSYHGDADVMGAVTTDHVEVSITGSSDLSDGEQEPSVCEESSLSFEILDTVTESPFLNDAELVGDESDSFQLIDSDYTSADYSQNPVLKASEPMLERDPQSTFINAPETEADIFTAKDYPSLSLPSKLTLNSGPDFLVEQNGLSGTSKLPDILAEQNGISSTSELPASPETQGDTASSGVETSPSGSDPTPQDADLFTSFGTELSSLSSLAVQAPAAEADKEEAFPSFATQFSSLSSFNTDSTPTPQAESQSDFLVFDQRIEQVQPEDVTEQGAETQNLSGLHSLDVLSLDTLDSMSESAGHASATDVEELHTRDNTHNETLSQAQDLFPTLDSNNSDVETHANLDQRVECYTDSTSNGEQLITYQSQADQSVNEESVSPKNQDCDVTESQGNTAPANTLPNLGSRNRFSASELSTNAISVSLGSSDGGGEMTSESSANANSVSLGSGGEMDWDSYSPTSTPPATDQMGDGAEGACASPHADSEPSSSSTDTDSTSNSDSGKDYVCEDTDGDASTPPPSSPAEDMDSEEYALQFVTELYLSKGLRMGRSFESGFLEPIPEEPLHSIYEESGVPPPSENSSADVRFEDVFEWDDFMGEPLEGKERSSSDVSSSRDSFDMSDWSLDIEGESLRSVGSMQSRPFNNQHRLSGSDSQYRGSADAPTYHSSGADSELASQGNSQRSYVTDFLSSRTKGLTLNTASSRASNQTHFYSLYGDDFDLGSDSQSEGSSSPPVPILASESRGNSLREGVLSWQEDLSPHPASSLEDKEDKAATDTQDFYHDGVSAHDSSDA